MNFRELPFLRISIPFIVGILLYPHFFIFEDSIYTLICVCFSLFFLLEKYLVSFKLTWVKGVFINIILLLLGNHIAHSHNQYEWNDHFKNQLTNSQALIVKIIECDTLGKSKKLTGKVLANLDTNFVLESRSGLLAIKTNDHYSQIQIGDIAYIEGKTREFETPKNPFAFNFKTFNANKQKYHKIHVDSLLTLQKSNNTYYQKIQYLKTDLLQIFDENIPSKKENAIAKALLLGHKSELDEEIKTAYANTGALHILAVSGLHVGILCLILLTIFNFIPFENNFSKGIKIIIILACLFFYCTLTGSTASVMRASIMYGFLMVGNELKRFSNIYNTVAASAFIILCLDPSMIKTVSFQLSYLALIGIVYFQPKLYALWIPKNKLLDYIWKLMCVSLAAQIITFPISVYYFNQLPLLSCISGIIAVPAAFAIFSLGLLLLLLNFIAPFFLPIISHILFFIIWLNNKFILCLQGIPNHKLINLSFETIDVCILFIILILTMAYISFKKREFLLLSLLIGICFSSKLILSAAFMDKEKVVMFYVPNAFLIDFYEGQNLYTIQSNDLTQKKEDYAAKTYRLKHKSIDHSKKAFKTKHYMQDGLILFGEKSIFLLNETSLSKIETKMDLDILVLQENTNFDKDQLLNYFNPKIVILDTSNSRSYNKNWETFLRKKSIKFHNIYEAGAFIN